MASGDSKFVSGLILSHIPRHYGDNVPRLNGMKLVDSPPDSMGLTRHIIPAPLLISSNTQVYSLCLDGIGRGRNYLAYCG